MWVGEPDKNIEPCSIQGVEVHRVLRCAGLCSVSEQFVCGNNHQQEVRAASGVKWFAISQNANGAAESALSPCFAIVETCRSPGDNHGHRNAKAGNAGETLP